MLSVVGPFAGGEREGHRRDSRLLPGNLRAFKLDGGARRRRWRGPRAFHVDDPCPACCRSILSVFRRRAGPNRRRWVLKVTSRKVSLSGKLVRYFDANTLARMSPVAYSTTASSFSEQRMMPTGSASSGSMRCRLA